MPIIQHVAAHLTHPQAAADAILDLQAGQVFNLKLAIGFGTADAAVLATLPTALSGPKNTTTLRYRLISAHWETTTSWTGGASSSIGLSSGTNALFNTKGDLLAATLAAALVSAAPFSTTSGTKFGNNGGVIVLNATDTIRFDQVVSTFTAGAGFAHLNFQLVN